MIEIKVTGTLKRLCKALVSHYGYRLSQVLLFGSQARGEATNDSDVDVLVILDDSGLDPFQEYRKWADWVTNELLESGELVNLIFTSRQRFDTVRSPLYINIHSEGIAIYDERILVAFGESL